MGSRFLQIAQKSCSAYNRGMLRWIAQWVVNALALYIVAALVPGIHILNFTSALFAVIIIGLVNTLLKPILFVLTLPVTILTLGIFSLILNALMLLLAGSVISGFRVDGFWAAFLGSILLSIVTAVFRAIIR